jgi:hypothetical protein
MQRLEATDRQDLMLKQTRFGARDFELYAGDDLVGVLYWPKLLSDRAVAETASGRWHIDRLGFFRDRVAVTDAGSGEELATLAFDMWGDGDLALADGRVLHWYQTKAFLRSAWALTDEQGTLLLEMEAGTRWFKYQVYIDLQPEASALRPLAPWTLVCWYLGYVKMQDAAAAVAATSAAVVVV